MKIFWFLVSVVLNNAIRVYERSPYTFWGKYEEIYISGSSHSSIPFQAVTSLVVHLSYIASRTWVNFRWRSSGATVAPRLPHRNLIWNSVRKASESNSSLLQPSRAISAFLRKSGKLSASLRAASRWDQTIDKPQSGAEFSQGERIAAARPEGATVPENNRIWY